MTVLASLRRLVVAAGALISRVRDFLSVPADKPALALAQYRAFQQQVPLLYCVLLSNVWVLAASYVGSAPPVLTFSLPLVLTAVCYLRLSMWWSSRSRERDAADARRELIRTNFLAWALSAAFSGWALGLCQYGSFSMQMHVAFFMAITTVGCMCCLSHLRSAALAVMATCTGSFVVYFGSTQHPTFSAMALNVLLVCVAMLVILLVNYRDFNALVESRQVLQEERSKAIDLSEQNLRLANLDSLTGLPNRRSFFSTLQSMVDREKEDGGRVILGILDLDGFKPVNDTYGHAVGDALLCRVVDRMVEVAGNDILVFRLGGDEFALLFQSSDVPGARTLAGSVCSALRAPFVLANCTVRLSSTMGLAISPDMARDANELYERADYAMYRAKRSAGRGEVRVFTADDEAEIKRSGVVEQALKTDDLEAELWMVFQPIVDITTDRTIGFEALARWDHPVLGQVSPAEFIPIAERAGLINKITLILLRKALASAGRWPDGMRLSFNLSALDVASPESLLRIAAAIGQSRVSPRRIDLEITETAMVSDVSAFMAAVDTLKRIGVGISLDDFGTGYSSLRQVHQLPLDKIKVDRSFIASIDQNLAGQKIVKSLLMLCEDLNLSCVIEGVETRKELEVIRGLGCRWVQGYYYGHPMEEAEISEHLSRAGQRSNAQQGKDDQA